MKIGLRFPGVFLEIPISPIGSPEAELQIPLGCSKATFWDHDGAQGLHRSMPIREAIRLLLACTLPPWGLKGKRRAGAIRSPAWRSSPVDPIRSCAAGFFLGFWVHPAFLNGGPAADVWIKPSMQA